VLFAGGTSGKDESFRYWDTVDIYDDQTGAWSVAKLSEPRVVHTAIVAGDLAIFAGGSHDTTPQGTTDRTVDIYDASTEAWSVAQLSSDRRIGSAVVVGTRVLFVVADGDQVDVFDTVTRQWSVKTLATTRTHPAVAVAGQQAVIVGTTAAVSQGARTSASPYERTPVDIYDAATDRWLTAELSDTRWFDVSAIGLGSRVYVAGGGIGGRMDGTVASDAVDVYETTTGTWTTLRLSQARMGILPVVAGPRILFAGGYAGFIRAAFDPDWTQRTDIYDTSSGAWSTAELTAGWRFTGLSVSDQAVFAGGYSGARSSITPNRHADAYDSQTGAWTRSEPLHQNYIELLTTTTIGSLGLVVSMKNIDMYDARAGVWSVLPLPVSPIDGVVATVGSRLLVSDSQDTVYIYDFGEV
jgi:hypothetical protein